jgi:MFS family permease
VLGRERFGPLTERPFRLLWLGRTGSSIGDSLIPVALAFAVLRIGGGATGLGIVLAAFTIGRASFVVVGGVWADRLPRRAVMITADLVRFGTLALTAGLLLGHAAHVWELAALQAIAGAAGGFFAPASTALVPQTVSGPRLQQANALLSLSQSATNIFGPALSGAIVATAGPGTMFAIDSVSFLVSAAFLTALRVEEQVRPAVQRFLARCHRGLEGGTSPPLVDSRLPRFRARKRRHRHVLRARAACLAGGPWRRSGLGVDPDRRCRGRSSRWLPRLRPQHPVATAFAIWSIGAVPVLALVPPLPLAVIVAASAAFGIAIVFGNTLWETALQQEVRPDRLARVGSIDWLLSLCLMPAGQALAGPLVGPLGVRGTLILAAALMSVPNLCVLAFVREVRQVRRRDTPDPVPA